MSTSVPGNEDQLPRRFGRYLLFDKIGEGGMARIYLGRARTDLGGERLLVVKRILPVLSSSTEFSRLLIDEAKLAARLTHGNIVQVFDLGREEDALYIAMEYVEGFDLRQLLIHCSKTGTPLPIEFSLHMVMEILRALDYAHRKLDEQSRPLGIVHRDVSPSNVLLSFDGEVKLCDFGIARALGHGEELPTEAIQGKAGYMSPEAANGDALDARSDVFSIGIMLWELLSGRRLYGKAATLEAAREAAVPPLPERDYPEAARLHEIARRALAKNPDERFLSARAMLREVEDYVRSARLLASPLRFGDWLTLNFGAEILEFRKARERAAKALEAGPLLELRALAPAERAVRSEPRQSSLEAAGAADPDAALASSPGADQGVSVVARSLTKPEPEESTPIGVWVALVLVLAIGIAVVILR